MAFSRSGAWGVCRDRVRTPGTAARSSRVGTQAHCHGTPLQDKRGRGGSHHSGSFHTRHTTCDAGRVVAQFLYIFLAGLVSS
jgi:hypothetical protein